MKTSVAAGLFATALLVPLAAGDAWAHATYNITGYGSGIGGSANGADGALPPTWTNGPIEYEGSLPFQWYLGQHSVPSVRTVQSGAGANPPSGSLLAQVVTYNVDNEPDLPVDRVLAVGGKSWSDPENNDQGWGHGLDFGLIHLSPIETLLAGGPVKMTITLTDDPSDGVSPRLAYALYAGFDAGDSSVRHQTFVTNPSPPAADPLGTTGLTLLDFAVAGSPGSPLTATYDVDPAHLGHYTIIIGAQGGVTGQYALTMSLSADPALGTCEAALADTDEDGVLDAFDDCDETAEAAVVDATGCSLEQFCEGFDASSEIGRKSCIRADWNNDQSLLPKRSERDCKVLTSGGPEPEPVGRTCIVREHP